MSIILNKDRELVVEVRKQLSANIEKYGQPYCPCVVPYAYELDNNEDYICMCKEFREQEKGACSCGLYIKV